MGYGDVWKILDGLVIEFRKRGEPVPPEVIEDLRAAKTMIQVLQADPSRAENIPSIETYLGNVESYLIFVGGQKFGGDLAENWMEKLREARKSVRIGEKEGVWKPTSKFIPGVPRDQKWLRVQISSETPEREIEELATQFGLSTKTQVDGFVLVYGDAESLRRFVHKAGEKLRGKKEP